MNSRADPEELRRIRKMREYEKALPNMQSIFRGTINMIARNCDTFFAGIHFLDEDKQWIKVCRGMDLPYMDKEHSVCKYTIEGGEPLLISDMRQDARSKDNFYVKSDPYLKSYMGVPLKTPDGYSVGTVCVMDKKRRRFTDSQISMLQTASDELIRQFELYKENAELKEKSERNAVLLKEIHHRLRNNLSLISGLVDLEKMRTSDPEFEQILDNIQKRINTVAMLHKRLYENDSLEQVMLKSYLQELAEDLRDSFVDPDRDIACRVEGDAVGFSEKRTLYVGLLVNELLTNVFKHAFRGKKQGEVVIQIEQNKDECELRIIDDGVGLPEDFSLKGNSSLGSKLIITFTNQLEGSIDYFTGPVRRGTCFRIKFPRKI